MSKTYEPCGPEVRSMLTSLVETFRDDLFRENVTIGLVFARNSGDGAAVSVGGHPATAKIKINSLADRVEGKPDATITIDEVRWNDLSDENRRALLHHEITHLELKEGDGDDGRAKRDDLGRPLLKSRKDDFAITGFHEIVERYKDDALEYQSIRRIAEHWQSEYQLSLFDLVGAGA